MKNLTLTTIIFLLPLAGLFAQSCPDTVKFSMQYSFDGPDLIVDLQVTNFQDIIGMQFGINYDDDVLTFESASSTIAGFNNGSYSDIPNGNIRVVWLSSNGQGQNIPDLGTLMQLRFTTKQVSASSTIQVSDKNLPFEVINSAASILCVSGNEIIIQTNPGQVSGKVSHDINKNCIFDNDEPTFENWMIELTSGQKKYYRTTDASGHFSFGLPAGSYNIRLLPLNELWIVCENSVLVNIVDEEEINVNFMANASLDCPKMFTDVSTPFLRRCFDNTYTILYQNKGTITAQNVSLELDFDDDLTFISSDYSNYNIIGDKIIFNLGDVSIYESGVIKVVFNLDCLTTEIGETHCVTASVFPNDPCIIPSNWSGAELAVSAICDEFSGKVRFKIENVGTGIMQNFNSFIVTEDDVLKPAPPPFKIEAMDFMNIEFPANGATYRIRVQQETNFPGLSQPTVAIEGCGTDAFGNFSKGFVTIFENDDRDLFVDVDCQQNIGSFDPNDIISFPTRFGIKHLIEKETKPEYLIRFQNTGTDTAFTVLIKNYIPATLDITSIEMGSSSHNYTYRFSQDRELIITFQDILLVDSTKNEALSHGYIKYKINPASNLIDGDKIENQAKIYFDFNNAVITNQVFHTIGRDFIIETVDWTGVKENINFYPNPTTDEITVALNDTVFNEISYNIRNTLGMCLIKGSITNAKNNISCEALSSGKYLLEMNIDGKSRAIVSFIKL
ncbi:MAG: T9SS type A sorting domain-containing protein [Saprospiraceae bacterium]|nr:T9SS type A sorting domain-containing protein [Saprospiraceae bacterium]